MSNEKIEQIMDDLSHYQQSYRQSEWRWKYAYRVLLVISVLSSTGAAIVGKLEYFKFAWSSDIVALLAGLAAVITTLILAFNFEVNWRISRKSRQEVETIMLDSKKSGADPDRLRDQLKQVIIVSLIMIRTF